ncbi:MAG: hypothetical protein AB7L94_26335 [Kofleriaceae bacterium]
MSTKLFVSLALALGLSACLTEIDEDETVLTGDDLETVQTEPNPPEEPADPNVVAGDGNNTCGGQPRLKADGPGTPK